MDPDPLLSDLSRLLRGVEEQDVLALARALAEAPAVHVMGGGRSGLVVRALAMGLVHAGRPAHVVGDTTAPALVAGDLLVVCAGSGASASLAGAAERARGLGGRVALITYSPFSPLARLAHLRLLLPPVIPTAASAVAGADPEAIVPAAQLLHPLRTLFTQACLILFDDVLRRVAAARGLSPADLEARRSNLH